MKLLLVALVGIAVFGGAANALAADESGAWRVGFAVLEQPAAATDLLSRFRSFLGSRAYLLRPAPGTKLVVTSSAYAPSPYQTDATPCITAAGTRVRPGVVATNFLPFGTILSVNGQRYIVEDRMNARYKGYYLDFYFASTSDALIFGRQRLEITIIGYGTPGQDLTEEPQDPSAIKRGGLRFLAALRRTSSYILTSVSTTVNRHDVNCAAE